MISTECQRSVGNAGADGSTGAYAFNAARGISDFSGRHNTICCHEKNQGSFAIQKCRSSGYLLQSKFVSYYCSFRLYTFH